MSSPNAFYIATPILFEIPTFFIALKLTRDVYADRGGLSELWCAPRRYKSSRVLRVVGFLGSLIGLMIHIDFYGVFGIYDSSVPLSLLWVGLALCSYALHVTLYHELVATLPFVGITLVNEDHKRLIGASLTLGYLFHLPMYCATFFVENRAVLLVGTIIAGLYAAGVVAMVNIVFFLIKRYHNSRKNDEMKSFSNQSASRWDTMLRKWRIYTVLVSVVLVASSLNMALQVLLPANWDRTINDLNWSVDPAELPSLESVMFPSLLLLFTLAAAVRSHIHSDDSRFSGTTEGGNGTKSSVASKKVLSTTGTQSEVISTDMETSV